MSHSSFFGPSKPFLGRRPCRRTCSSTMKKCCNGKWSLSNWRPKRTDCSNNSLTTNLQMFTRLLRSIAAGSFAVGKNLLFCWSRGGFVGGQMLYRCAIIKYYRGIHSILITIRSNLHSRQFLLMQINSYIYIELWALHPTKINWCAFDEEKYMMSQFDRHWMMKLH